MENDNVLMKIRRDIDKTACFVVKCMIEKKLSISVAESCTGGLLSSAITSVPGASEVFGCGIVSYSIIIKEELLGVDKTVIDTFGVVSQQTSLAMAQNAKRIAKSDFSVGITGLAGPGGEKNMPAGTVYLTVIFRDKSRTENLMLYGLSREEVRLKTVLIALKWVEDFLTCCD